MARRIITLTTDFGLSDAYVGIMKGVILSLAPDVQLVDISHLIPPQNVPQAAYLLVSLYAYFPANAIHLAVVDPGVGTARRPVAIQSPHGAFVGPDNGLFVPVLAAQGVVDAKTGAVGGTEVVALTNPEYWRHPVSRTFHGRDIFSPAAAHLALGEPLSMLGEPVSSLTPLPGAVPTVRKGVVYGSIAHIDHFGNAVSNISSPMVPEEPVVEVGGRKLRGLCASYQDSPIAALIGSNGFLEIAVRNGSAAVQLGLSIGSPVVVRSGG